MTDTELTLKRIEEMRDLLQKVSNIYQQVDVYTRALSDEIGKESETFCDMESKLSDLVNDTYTVEHEIRKQSIV